MASDVIEEAVKFLEAIKDDYPSGLALQARLAELTKTASAEKVVSPKTENQKLIFALISAEPEAFLSSQVGQLALASIEKGLKKSLESVELVVAEDSERLLVKVQEALSKNDVCGVVAFGDTVWKTFTNVNIERGMWFSFQGCPVIATEALEQALVDVSVKKNFWNDLKSVMQRFNW